MAKRIITISREFGSGGRFIGEEVAKKLGIAYYDKSIINEIAEKSGKNWMEAMRYYSLQM